jgi:hypothetical protein
MSGDHFMRSFPGIFMTCLVAIHLPVLLIAQQEGFSKMYSLPNNTINAYSVAKTFDGGFMIAGQNDSPFVLKVNNAGNVLWSRSIGEFGDWTYFNNVIATSDSNYLLGGIFYNPVTASDDIVLVKISSSGDTIWSKAIDMGYNESLMSLRQTNDNGFILTGDVDSGYYSTAFSMFIAKLDPYGNLSWGRLIDIPNSTWQSACSVVQNADSSYTLIGDSYHQSSGDVVWLRFPKTGGLQGPHDWAKKYTYYPAVGGGAGASLMMADGGYISVFYQPNDVIVMMKSDLSGNKLWSNYYHINLLYFNSSYPWLNLHRFSDNTYLFSYTINTDNSHFGEIFKLDTSGNLIWKRDIGMGATDVAETDDHRLLIAGNGYPIGFTAPSFFGDQVGLLKTDPSGYLASCISPDTSYVLPFYMNLTTAIYSVASGGQVYPYHPNLTVLNIVEDNGCIQSYTGIVHSRPGRDRVKVFPNPADGSVTICIDPESAGDFEYLEISNMGGTTLLREVNPRVLDLAIDLKPFPGGLYFVRVVLKKRIFLQKLVICH